MYINEKHLKILKDFLDRKIDPEDIEEEDKPIIIELCKVRKRQLTKKLEIKTQILNELKEKLKNKK